METTKSKDGTTIAFQRSGTGPPLVLVVGAFCTRTTTVDLTPLLAPNFTVFEYDRRGRGDSDDKTPYAVDREIEDLRAVITEAGGQTYVYGHSSGAALAVQAAAAGVPMTKLVAYEPPYATTEDDRRSGTAMLASIRQAVTDGRTGDAAIMHLSGSGMPANVIDMIKNSPGWADMIAVAHTLPYDWAITTRGVEPDKFARITVPTLVLTGGDSSPYLHAGAAATAAAIPDAKLDTIAGQGHVAARDVIAPILQSWFS